MLLGIVMSVELRLLILGSLRLTIQQLNTLPVLRAQISPTRTQLQRPSKCGRLLRQQFLTVLLRNDFFIIEVQFTLSLAGLSPDAAQELPLDVEFFRHHFDFFLEAEYVLLVFGRCDESRSFVSRLL